MQQTITAILLLLVFASNTQAQRVEKEPGSSTSASQVYLEAGGLSILYSINYDQRFKKEENGLGFRFGIGGVGGGNIRYFTVPVQLNYLFGNSGQYLELGAGASYIHTDNFLFNNNLGRYLINGSATIGFRKVPFNRKGLTWRVAFTPFIDGGKLYPWLGASLGYRF